jgi:Ran GTPase-activating protein (RanGAP) involved in mRNA processing and transport
MVARNSNMVSLELQSDATDAGVANERSVEERHEMDRTLHVSSSNTIAAGSATIEEEENTTAITTTNTTTTTTAEELMLLLRRVRHNDARIRHVNLQRKRLPVAYLRALFSVLISNNQSIQSTAFPTTNTVSSSSSSSCCCLHLTRLRLSHSGVNDAVVINVVADFVACNTSVVDLDLSRNEGMSDTSGLALAAALQQQTTTQRTGSTGSSRKGVLECLDLSGTLLGPASIAALCAAIPCTGIHTLKLASLASAVGTKQGRVALTTLLMHRHCPLRKLDVRNCHLGNVGASALALALFHQHELYVVQQNTVAAAVAAAAAATTDDDVAADHNVTTLVQPLQALYLGRNHIGDKGLTDLVAVLESNTTLQTLDVQANVDITDVSADLMVQCLSRHNHSLRKLKLRHCTAISDTVKERLLDALLMNAHGPDLAAATKRAWQVLLLVQCSRGTAESWSRSTLFHHLRAMMDADTNTQGNLHLRP